MKEENQLKLNLGIVLRGDLNELEKIRKYIKGTEVRIIYLKTSGYRINLAEDYGRKDV